METAIETSNETQIPVDDEWLFQVEAEKRALEDAPVFGRASWLL